jgi:spore coat protein U-like protein
MKQQRIWLQILIAGVFWPLLYSSTVYAACSVSSTSINFGNYDFLSSAPNTGIGSITLSCAPSADVTIAIGASSNSGAFSPRQMKDNVFGDTLEYGLYTGTTMIQVWGDGTNGTATVNVSNVKKNNISPIIIYGRIDPQQNVSAGSYSELLTVTITY